MDSSRVLLTPFYRGFACPALAMLCLASRWLVSWPCIASGCVLSASNPLSLILYPNPRTKEAWSLVRSALFSFGLAIGFVPSDSRGSSEA